MSRRAKREKLTRDIRTKQFAAGQLPPLVYAPHGSVDVKAAAAAITLALRKECRIQLAAVGDEIVRQVLVGGIPTQFTSVPAIGTPFPQ